MMTSSRVAPLLLLLSLSACSEDDPSPYEPPGGSLHGASMETWAARWWQWALSIPAAENPVLDQPCDADQDGDVFFLAGNFGGSSTRACTVPPGKALMVPIVNYLCFPTPEDPVAGCATPDTEAELTACANAGIDDVIITASVVVDGVVLEDFEDYRATSAQFAWTAPADPDDYLFPGIGPIEANECGIPEGDRFGVTDGYWLMLRPLSPGQHHLRFQASVTIPGGPEVFALDVSYDLTQE